MVHGKGLTRWDFLRVAAFAATGALIAACAPATREAPPVVEATSTQPAVSQPPTAEKVAPTPTFQIEEQPPAPTVQTASATPTAEVVQAADTFIAKTADVPPGSAFDFTWQDKPAIVINLDGEYKAYRNVCTHNGCATKYYGGDNLTCPCHSSIFEVANGDVRQGPATSPLRSIDVAVEGDSIVVAA
jgi:nitrite reductase/ring-hydroxylating ferredoxin subunit